MASSVTEAQIINKIADYFQSIDGITRAYQFANNPDTLTDGVLPATLFFPRETTMEHTANFNVWTNNFDIVAITFVAPRMSSGGKLKFLENKAISLMPAVRTKFQERSVILDILGLGLVKGFISSTVYGSGGPLLTHNGIEYIGIITTFDFKEKK